MNRFERALPDKIETLQAELNRLQSIYNEFPDASTSRSINKLKRQISERKDIRDEMAIEGDR